MVPAGSRSRSARPCSNCWPRPRPRPRCTALAAEPTPPSDLTDRFSLWATGAVRKLALYRRLCEGAAGDTEVPGLLNRSPHPSQRIPNLLLAAVHDLVLAHDPHPAVGELARWYGSVTDRSNPVGPGPDDPWPHFRRVALEHPGVADRIATRATQTNEVGRCATVMPVLAALEAAEGPLALVEMGASAGLNLLVDRWSYRYTRRTDANAAAVEVARAMGGGGPVLTCELRGEGVPPIPEQPPVPAHRVGVDLNPVDLGDPAQARWLLACQWPDEPERVERARLAIAEGSRIRPRVEQGDAVDRAADLLRSVPAGMLPVLVSTWVLSYLTEPRRRELSDRLGQLGGVRDFTMVFAEQPELVGGLEVPPRPDGRPDGSATALVRIDWRGGERRARRLADQHPHGSWLEWLVA